MMAAYSSICFTAITLLVFDVEIISIPMENSIIRLAIISIQLANNQQIALIRFDKCLIKDANQQNEGEKRWSVPT